MAKRTAVNAAEKFRQRKKCSMGNTQVVIDKDGNASMLLFGNRIAVLTANERLFITTCGWETQTTFSRLREICPIAIRRRRGILSLNGEDWDGRWIEIIQAPPVVIIAKNTPPELILE